MRPGRKPRRPVFSQRGSFQGSVSVVIFCCLSFAYAKTKPQISFAVTANLISAFVFTTQILQSLYFLNPRFQASSHLQWLYSLVCVGPGRRPRRPVFSQRGSYEPRCKKTGLRGFRPGPTQTRFFSYRS